MVAAVSLIQTVAEIDDQGIEILLQRATRIRGNNLAIKRAYRLIHDYRAENVSRGEDYRADERVVACLAQISTYREKNRELRQQIAEEVLRAEPLKQCQCGAVYTRGEWDNLEFVEFMSDGEGGLLELRQCRCDSTIDVPVRSL